MSLASSYQSQITDFDKMITGCSGIMSQITIQGLTGTTLAACLQKDYDLQMATLNILTQNKDAIQAKLDRLNSGWTGQYATYVSEINSGYTGVYSKRFDRLLGEDKSSEYTEFFTAYGQATNDFQKERLLKMTFGQ